MAIDKKENWLNEFTKFSHIKSEHVLVPAIVLENLKRRLFPNPWITFGKVIAIHAVIGFFSLTICNQFGLNPFQTEQSLTNWFMKIAGYNFCMLLCGIFFMSTTYVLANFFLNLEEIETIRRYEWLQTGIMGLISLAAFYFFGAELVGAFTFLWFVGGLLGGFLSIESSYRIRRYLNFAEKV